MESTAFPRLVFPISSVLKKTYYSATQNGSLFDGDNLVLWMSSQGVYVPEFDQPPPSIKGIGNTFTPYHRRTHARFTVSLSDNREEVYWILKQLEEDSFNGANYVPVRCFDYVLPDPQDRVQGYSERLSTQFFVRTEGGFLIKQEDVPSALLAVPTYSMNGSNLVDENGNIIFKTQQKYFHKISLFFEINRTN